MKFSFPLKIALQYTVFGGLWIIASDLIVEYFWSDIMPSGVLQTVKGLLFILATSLFIFFLLQRESRRIAASEKKALEHASRHRAAFDSSPEPLWEEDFSGVKAALDALRNSGVEDVEAHLDVHPEFVSECIRKIRVIDANQAAVAYHEAASRSELLQSLSLIFTEASWPGLKQEILAMARSETRCDVQVAGQTLSGRPLEFIVRWSVLTGHEDTFDRVYLAVSDVTELTRVKKELEASEQKYRVLVEHAGEAVMVIQNQTIHFANAAATTLTGLPHDQLLGSGLGPLLHPEDREWVLDRHRRRLAGEDPLSRYSLRMICAKGQIRWVEISVERIEWSGRPSVLMIASDITERKKEQEELQNTKNLLEKIFNNLEEAVLLVDPPERRIVACNPAVENIFGYGQEELTGRSTQILHTDEKSFKKFMELMRPGLGGKGPFHTKYRMRRKDSQEIITDITVTAIDELLGWGLGVISVIRDITAQESAEKSLRESEKKYRTLLENATESVVVIQDWRIVFCNQQFKETTGFQAEDLQGTSFRDLVYRDDFSSLEALINRLQSGGQSPRDIEFRIKDNRSGLLWMRANAAGLDWNEGAAVMALMNDITDQKALEQQNKEMEARMLQAQKLESVGTLAGGISHDFNNLLSVILGFSRLARDELSEGDPMRKHLSTVVEAGERAVELVEQILTFSRREKEDKHPFQIHVIIKEALKMLRTSIPPHIEIQQDIRTEKYVLMDPGQAHQVIMNLCTNAYQALPETGGKIEIRLSEYRSSEQGPFPELQPGDYLCLSVADNGEGISPEDIGHIFEPYFTTKETGRGTGLGLSVVHGIVTGAGGTIDVHSQPDRGTSFDVFLPEWTGEIQTGSPSPEEEHSVSGGQEHLLLVDDEYPVLKLLEINLKSAGYRISAYTEPSKALEAVRQNPSQYNAVITDLSMPEMTGKELARALADIRPDLPIIVCTGLKYGLDAQSAPSGNIQSVISKPVDKQSLSKIVRQVLDQQAAVKGGGENEDTGPPLQGDKADET